MMVHVVWVGRLEFALGWLNWEGKSMAESDGSLAGCCDESAQFK
jgi:hypothetical protein